MKIRKALKDIETTELQKLLKQLETVELNLKHSKKFVACEIELSSLDYMLMEIDDEISRRPHEPVTDRFTG